MKNVIESLFAGLLENNNFSEKPKNNTGDNKDNFSSDINEILSLNNADSESENIVINNIVIDNENNNSENNIGATKFNSIGTSKELHEEVRGFPSKTKELENIKEYSKNEENLIALKAIRKKSIKTSSNFKNIEANNSQIANNQKNINILSKNKFNIDNKITNFIEKKNSNFSIMQHNKGKKIKTFFKNYLNFSNLKNAVKNKKVIKIITSNSLNVNYKEESLFNKKSKTVPNKNINEKVVKNILERDNNIFNSKNSTENVNLENSNNEKSFYQNKTADSLLKNILDIKSNNINHRLSEIFERNIKLGNNKFEIQIRPEHLGKIEVTMEINGDNIDITLKVENTNVASLLSENNVGLQKSLSSQGLNLNNFNLNYNNQNKFSEDNLSKEKKEEIKKNSKEEENLDLTIEKHYKNNNLVYIKA